MDKSIRKPLPLIALIMLVGSHSPALTQRRLWREVKGKSLVKFDWNCASTSAYPSRKLSRIARAALSREDTGPPRYADRAFAFDLNGDGRLEYFVPLVCGGTGNCTWGVFASNPARLLGIVGGEYVYVHKRKGGWPNIITYDHWSVVEGSLNTYHFRKGKYIVSGTGYPINHRYGTYDLDIQGGPGHKTPDFLERARAGCAEIGW